MRVFLTGASGWIGSAVAWDLLAAGHNVVGLVRSREKGEALVAAGGTVVVGSLADVDVLRSAEEERRAREAFADVYAGTERPIVVTDGFLGATDRPAVEYDRPAVDPAFPRASEQTAFGIAE